VSYKKVEGFKPHDEKKDKKVQFINFGSEGEAFILHISKWTTYEMPALKDTWRPTLFILDHEGRGIRINSKSFQALLKPFWNKKSSLVIRRTILKDKQGELIYSTTKYHVNQLDPKSLWVYESPAEPKTK